jgi:hypothetical protein
MFDVGIRRRGIGSKPEVIVERVPFMGEPANR